MTAKKENGNTASEVNNEAGAQKTEGKQQPDVEVPAKKKSVTKKNAPIKNETPKGAAKNDNAALLGKTEILRVDPMLLVFDVNKNARIDYGNLKELELSIKARGVENPIRVKRNAEGKLEVVAGYRRTRACVNLAKAGHKVVAIPAILEKRGTTEKDTLLHQYVENDGKPFTAFEEGILFQRMIDGGMPLKEISANIGKTVGTIKKRLSLLTCSKKVSAALQKEVISMRIALHIILVSKGDHTGEERMLSQYEEALSTGDKQKVKKVRDDIHEKANSRTTGMTAKRTKQVLSDIAQLYTDFIRSKKPANSLNVQWVALDKELRKLRTARRKGQLSG